MISNIALSDIARWTGPIALALLTWFIVELIAKPFLRFRDLRGEIQRTLFRRFVATRIHHTLSTTREDKVRISREHAIKFKQDLGELAVSLLVFWRAESLGSLASKMLGYAPPNVLAAAAIALACMPLPEGERLLGEGDKKFEEIERYLREGLRLESEAKLFAASEALLK